MWSLLAWGTGACLSLEICLHGARTTACFQSWSACCQWTGAWACIVDYMCGVVVFNATYRVCVDLASLLVPGEGLLVGSFARALFLVHSECSESAYINSRPFRINAGPVCSDPFPTYNLDYNSHFCQLLPPLHEDAQHLTCPESSQSVCLQ